MAHTIRYGPLNEFGPKSLIGAERIAMMRARIGGTCEELNDYRESRFSDLTNACGAKNVHGDYDYIVQLLRARVFVDLYRVVKPCNG